MYLRSMLIDVVHSISYAFEICSTSYAMHLGRVSKTGHTPLSLASANGHLDTVKYLVKDHHCDLECKFKFDILTHWLKKLIHPTLFI